MTEIQAPERNEGPRGGRKTLAWVIAACIVLGLAVAVANRNGSRAPAATTSPEDHTTVHAEDHRTVQFSPESLKLADLGVTAVRHTRRGARLAVTGEAEPNLGGVVKITPRVAGKIVSVRVNVGDSVNPGQTMAVLASTELAEAQATFRQASARMAAAADHLARQKKLANLGAFGKPEIEEARARSVEAEGTVRTALSEVSAAESEVAEAVSGLAASNAALTQAKTRERLARSRFARTETLLREELVSRQEWETSQADADSATADVEAADAGVTQSQARVKTAKSRLHVAEARLTAARKQSDIAGEARKREEAVFRGGYSTSREIVEAESTLRQARLEKDAAANRIRLLGGHPGGGDHVAITPPLGGRVTEQTVTLGETVTPEQTLFTVINLDTVWVQLNVYPRDISSVRVGRSVEITSDAAPGRTFKGVVSHIGDVADETTRTVRVRCVIQNHGGRLKPGAFVRGNIVGATGKPAITVPKSAVQSMDGKPVVFVKTGNTGEFKARPVVTGASFGDEIAIVSGLEPGQQIVVNNAFVVKAEAVKGELEEH